MYALSSQPGLQALPFLQKLNLLPNINKRFLETDIEIITRKAAHVLEYAMLYILVYISSCFLLFKNGEKRVAKAVFFSMLFCFAFSISDEFHQLFVAKRSGRILDIFIDTFGIFLGQFFTLCGVLIIPQKKK